jgi:hypothetical protein
MNYEKEIDVYVISAKSDLTEVFNKMRAKIGDRGKEVVALMLEEANALLKIEHASLLEQFDNQELRSLDKISDARQELSAVCKSTFAELGKARSDSIRIVHEICEQSIIGARAKIALDRDEAMCEIKSAREALAQQEASSLAMINGAHSKLTAAGAACVADLDLATTVAQATIDAVFSAHAAKLEHSRILLEKERVECLKNTCIGIFELMGSVFNDDLPLDFNTRLKEIFDDNIPLSLLARR